jgi:hypothetical protein
MRDLNARLLRHQLDLRHPHGSHQHEPMLRPCQAHCAAEAEQLGAHDYRARFLQDLSAECLLPCLISSGRPPGQPHLSPSLLISTTRSSAVTQKAFAPWGIPSGTAVGGCQAINQSPPLERTAISSLSRATVHSNMVILFISRLDARTAPSKKSLKLKPITHHFSAQSSGRLVCPSIMCLYLCSRFLISSKASATLARLRSFNSG